MELILYPIACICGLIVGFWALLIICMFASGIEVEPTIDAEDTRGLYDRSDCKSRRGETPEEE